MTGAMYAAIAGLKTHMQNLNVIGNNIANVNTNGYKAQRSVFRTALYTSISGGSNGTTTVGGQNPSQIGYGVSLATVDIDMSTGNYGLTGKATDCMIDGDGFFLVGDKTVAGKINPQDPDSFKTLTLTRVGNFEFKADGYLTDNKGSVVYGFLCVGKTEQGDAVLSDQLVPIRLPQMQTVTEEVPINPADPDAGTKEETRVVIQYPTVSAGADGMGKLTDFTATGNNAGTVKQAQFDSITIDPATGKITGTTTDDQDITIGYMALGTVSNPNGVTQQTDTYYKCGEGAGDLTVTMLGGAADDVYICTGEPNADTGASVPAGGTPCSAVFTVGGGANGTGANCQKRLMYVNGSKYNIFSEADNGGGAGGGGAGAGTGAVTLGERAKVQNGGKVALLTGGLEMSKTDLATEISGLITTQRGYQANTRIVTVTDSMLEELVNMKR